MRPPLRSRPLHGARAPHALLLALLCACGADAKPGASDAETGASDGAAVDGNEPGDGGTMAGSTDAGPPGPPVTVDPLALSRLQLREARDVCVLDAQGAVACRAPNTELEVLRRGPFVSFVLNQKGAGCGLTSTGALDCWSSERDVLCQASSQFCLHGGLPPPGVTWQDVALGEDHGCGVAIDGSLQCWGNDTNRVRLKPSGNDFVRVVIADEASCALTSTGEVRCWGGNHTYGNLPSDAVSIVMNGEAACALRKDGSVRCDNWAPNPPIAASGKRLARLSMHEEGMCTLTSDGQPSCNVGDGIARVTPPPGPFVQLSSTDRYACGLRGDGQLQCWGEQWGNGEGPESCALYEAKLNLNGQARTFEVSRDAWRNVEGWKFGSSWSKGMRFEPQQYLHLIGEGMSPKGPIGDVNFPGHQYPADTKFSLRASYWMLDATNTGVGPITCSGVGSTVRMNGDELLVDMQKVATLSCPGRPVEGSISFCAGQNCTRGSGTGSLQGVPWTAVAPGYPPLPVDQTTLEDGSLLVARLGESSRSLQWGLLFTSHDGPFEGEVLCVGTGQYLGENLPDSFQLSNLSALDPCPSGATGTLSGCLR